MGIICKFARLKNNAWHCFCKQNLEVSEIIICKFARLKNNAWHCFCKQINLEVFKRSSLWIKRENDTP